MDSVNENSVSKIIVRKMCAVIQRSDDYSIVRSTSTVTGNSISDTSHYFVV